MKSQLSRQSPMPSHCQRTSAWDHGRNRCPGPKVRANWSKPFFPSQPDVHRVLEGHMLPVALENHLQSIKTCSQSKLQTSNRKAREWRRELQVPDPSAGCLTFPSTTWDAQVHTFPKNAYLCTSCASYIQRAIAAPRPRMAWSSGGSALKVQNSPCHKHLPPWLPWVTGPPNDIARSHQVRRWTWNINRDCHPLTSIVRPHDSDECHFKSGLRLTDLMTTFYIFDTGQITVQTDHVNGC